MECCICGKKCENQWGNNPWPLKTNGTGRCCNGCNEQYVLVARSIMATDIEEVKKYIEKKRSSLLTWTPQAVSSPLKINVLLLAFTCDFNAFFLLFA